MFEGSKDIPNDPNARRDQALSAILGELKKTNKLLETNGKTLERIERNTRPTKILSGQNVYFERTNGGGDNAGDSPTSP